MKCLKGDERNMILSTAEAFDRYPPFKELNQSLNGTKRNNRKRLVDLFKLDKRQRNNAF